MSPIAHFQSIQNLSNPFQILIFPYHTLPPSYSPLLPAISVFLRTFRPFYTTPFLFPLILSYSFLVLILLLTSAHLQCIALILYFLSFLFSFSTLKEEGQGQKENGKKHLLPVSCAWFIIFLFFSYFLHQRRKMRGRRKIK